MTELMAIIEDNDLNLKNNIRSTLMRMMYLPSLAIFPITIFA